MTLKRVFLLWHTRPMEGAEEDVKLIGVYSSNELAEKKIIKYQAIDGFKESPNGFEVGEYIIDKDHWEEGFITTEE